MRQVLYAMRFTGQAEPVGEVGNVLRATTSAPSSTLTEADGLRQLHRCWASDVPGGRHRSASARGTRCTSPPSAVATSRPAPIPPASRAR